jgi:Flp pilus assembly protein TadG
MDTGRQIRQINMNRRRGSVTILLAAILLAFLLLFLVVGIYYVRGELQNAADAGALAGVVLVDPTKAATDQADARNEAQKFTGLNKAAGTGVATALNPGNDPNGDIVVGHWDDQTKTFDPNGTPINALKVVARRTRDAANGTVSVGDNPVGMIFGGALVNWPTMNIKRVAIAALLPPPLGPFPICLPSCSLTTPFITEWGYSKQQLDNDPTKAGDPILCTDPNLPPGNGNSNSTDTPSATPGLDFAFNPSADQGRPGLAWTNFYTVDCNVNPACNMPTKNEVEPYIFGKRPPDICNKNICTTNGNINPLAKDVQDVFNAKKTPVSLGGQSITGWRITVPIVDNTACGVPNQACPGAQNGQANPYYVVSYAEILMTQVTTSGTQGFTLIGLTNPRQETFTFKCKEQGALNTKTITRWVSTINCLDCTQPQPPSPGSSAALVK